MSKIVLAYAENYWKPSRIPFDGIGLVAQNCYNSIQISNPESEIIYVDFNNYAQLRGIKDVTALYSISGNLDKFRKVCKPEMTTLISVNESALLRRGIRDAARGSGRNSSYLGGHDGIYSNLNETKDVDFVLGFGGWSLFQSYVSSGFDRQKVLPIGWHYWDEKLSPKPLVGNQTILIYLGAICFRKGVDYVIDMARFLKSKYPNWKIRLAGFTFNAAWETELKALEIELSENFEWVNQRIEYGKSSWINLGIDTAFAIFPSREEGLAGCAMDVINLGIPLFHSDKIGIEIADESIAAFDFEHGNWREALVRTIKEGAELWERVRANQSKIAFFQNPSNKSSERAFQRISRGSIWPQVNLSDKLPSDYLESLGLPKLLGTNKKGDYFAKHASQKEGDSPGIVPHYLGEKNLSESDSFQLGLYLVEKINQFSTVRLQQENGFARNIEISSNVTLDENSKGFVSIWIKEYSNPYLERGKTVQSLFLREFFLNFLFQIRYRMSRAINITYLKISYELRRLLSM